MIQIFNVNWLIYKEKEIVTDSNAQVCLNVNISYFRRPIGPTYPSLFRVWLMSGSNDSQGLEVGTYARTTEYLTPKYIRVFLAAKVALGMQMS